MRAVWGVLSAVLGSYLASSRLHLYPPWTPAWTSVDLGIPFVEAALFVYASHYLLVAGGLLCLSPAERPRALRQVLAATAVSLAFFVLLPVATPPGPTPTGALASLLFAGITRVDTNANAFPSLHASLALLVAWAVARDRPAWRPWALAWGWAVAASTVLTKRHFAADLAAGVALAYSCRAALSGLYEHDGAQPEGAR